MDLVLDVERAADVATVSVAGEVDIDSGGRLADVLRDLGPECSTVVVDCSRLSFIDSTGLAILLRGHRDLEERDGRLELRDPPPMLGRLLKIVGLDDVFHLTRA